MEIASSTAAVWCCSCRDR